MLRGWKFGTQSVCQAVNLWNSAFSQFGQRCGGGLVFIHGILDQPYLADSSIAVLGQHPGQLAKCYYWRPSCSSLAFWVESGQQLQSGQLLQMGDGQSSLLSTCHLRPHQITLPCWRERKLLANKQFARYYQALPGFLLLGS